MSDRRQFLSTLGKMLGTTGLLLPLAGKGALALPDLGKAAALPVSVAPMPFSREGIALREVRRELRKCYLGQHDYPTMEAYSRAWRDLMRHHYTPLAQQVAKRPAATWADCVELAEICLQAGQRRDPDHGAGAPFNALVEAVLSLGGGERFYVEGDRIEEGIRHG